MLDRKGQAILLTMVFVGVTLGIAVGSYQQEPATELAVFPDDAVTLLSGDDIDDGSTMEWFTTTTAADITITLPDQNSVVFLFPPYPNPERLEATAFMDEDGRYSRFVFYVDVEVMMNEAGNVVVEIVR